MTSSTEIHISVVPQCSSRSLFSPAASRLESLHGPSQVVLEFSLVDGNVCVAQAVRRWRVFLHGWEYYCIPRWLRQDETGRLRRRSLGVAGRHGALL